MTKMTKMNAGAHYSALPDLILILHNRAGDIRELIK